LLLHVDDTSTWARWLEAASIENTRFANGPVFNQASMAIDAAVDGQGVVLGRTALVARDLVAGRLVCPFGPALSVPYAYWLVCPKANVDLPKIASFRKWLTAEAAEDILKLNGLVPASRSR
jgi:LysR family glycine cleavage system transcriptional activator